MDRRSFGGLLVFVLTICIMFSGCASFAGAGGPHITVVNNTGHTILFVFISESTSTSWGKDLLESDQVLHEGESFRYTLRHPIDSVNVYDFRLVNSNGDEYIKMNITVRNGSNISFTSADLTNPFVTIINNTGNTVWYVQMSESTNDSWGPDLLDTNQVLPNGGYFNYQLPFLISRVDTYDIRLIDADGDIYVKWEERVRPGSRIIFTMSDIDIDQFIDRVQ